MKRNRAIIEGLGEGNEMPINKKGIEQMIKGIMIGFSIIAVGIVALTGCGKESLSGIIDTTSPANIEITSITSTIEVGGHVNTVAWKNPVDDDFKAVWIIIRADHRFATNEADIYDDSGNKMGITYEVNGEPGKSQVFQHPAFSSSLISVPENELRDYYKIYSVDNAGNYSSGVTQEMVIREGMY